MDEEAEEGEGESSPRVLQLLLEMSEGVEGEAVPAEGEGGEATATAAKEGDTAKKDDKGKEQAGDKKQGGDKKASPEKKPAEKK